MRVNRTVRSISSPTLSTAWNRPSTNQNAVWIRGKEVPAANNPACCIRISSNSRPVSSRSSRTRRAEGRTVDRCARNSPSTPLRRGFTLRSSKPPTETKMGPLVRTPPLSEARTNSESWAEASTGLAAEERTLNSRTIPLEASTNRITAFVRVRSRYGAPNSSQSAFTSFPSRAASAVFTAPAAPNSNSENSREISRRSTSCSFGSDDRAATSRSANWDSALAVPAASGPMARRTGSPGRTDDVAGSAGSAVSCATSLEKSTCVGWFAVHRSIPNQPSRPAASRPVRIIHRNRDLEGFTVNQEWEFRCRQCVWRNHPKKPPHGKPSAGSWRSSKGRVGAVPPRFTES